MRKNAPEKLRSVYFLLDRGGSLVLYYIMIIR